MNYNRRYETDNYPKTFGEAVRKIMSNACLAAVMCIIVYMSILFIYRSVGNPTVIGYTETVMEFNSDGEAVSEKQTNTYYFEKGEEVKVPESAEGRYYNKIYGKDLFPEVFSAILMFIIASFMTYSNAWGFGSHSNNSDKIANKKHSVFTGIKLGVFSSGAFFASYLVMLLAKLFYPFNFALSLFGLVNAAYLPLLNAFVENPYGTVGLVAVLNNSPNDFSWIGMLVMLVPLVIKTIICFIGYELGYRNISLKEKIVYKG